MTTTIAERVAAGAAWLDEHRPGWDQRIDLETLDLGDPCHCVLGQEYGNYGDSPEEIRWERRPAGEDVWVAPLFGFHEWNERNYDVLTAEWRRLIEERRAAR